MGHSCGNEGGHHPGAAPHEMNLHRDADPETFCQRFSPLAVEAASELSG